MSEFLSAWSESSLTAVGFFWKAGWAFVLGYFVSAMIQAFVPKARLAPHLGGAGPKSVSLATLFGSISSSCSFAALATARALVTKGAHFVAAIAFMFASTNLVIELGILILVFLGWPFLLAEVIGGIFLIAVSSVLVALFLPRSWRDAARKRAEEGAADEEEDFDPMSRIRSREGWELVGKRFVMEWKMVWEDILIGFTVAGLMAALVPASFWKAIFLSGGGGEPSFLVSLENALVAPFVAAATFIGSMGNIPLATVLAGSGVAFAGIMGFIYSDLMVPPLVRVNSKYYGARMALAIAGVMYVSIVATALVLNGAFAALGWIPETSRTVADTTRFALDYTFWLNVAFVLVAAGAVRLSILHARHREHGGHDHGDGSGGIGLKRAVVLVFLAILGIGLVLRLAGF